jgi:putative transposase
MPWKHSSVIVERERFALLALKKTCSFTELCRQFGITRQTGYKWCQRHRAEGRRGVVDRSRAPKQPAQPQARRWKAKVLQVRRANPHWGAEKLRVELARRHPRQPLPSGRTMARWLQAAGLARVRPRRARPGPALPHPGLTVPRRRHEVWTVDYKGWYRTGDHQRQEPLTVRDLFSRYLLAIRLLPNQSEQAARAAFVQIFRRHGLPQAIRVDNGAPFGGQGALGLTRLSVWWQRLGIRVEFTRRARPGDNAGHEQMHGVYAREVAATAAADRAREQRRAERWRRLYNERRPHAALGQRYPAARYAPSRRAYPGALPPLRYAKGWSVRWVRPKGEIKWAGRLRYVGRAFARERVGLRPLEEGVWAVYLGSLLIGELHAKDTAGMRPARWQRGPAAPPPAPEGGGAGTKRPRVF